MKNGVKQSQNYIINAGRHGHAICVKGIVLQER